MNNLDPDDPIIQNRILKQEYLRETIINGGFDPLEFKEFCDSKKFEGGSNIDIWTIEELVEIVEEFRKRSTENKDPSIEDEQKIIHNEESIEKPISIPQSSSNVQSEILNTEVDNPKKDKYDYYYSKVLCVRKTDPTVLNLEKHIEIVLSDAEIVKGGILTSSYITFEVKSKPFDWCVRRKMDDFFWLKKTLEKFHPSVIVPPVPKQSKIKFDDDFISKRTIFLENFLNSCLNSEELKSCKYLMYFLSIDDEKSWKSKQKEADKFSKYQKLEDYPSLHGKVILNISDECNVFCGLIGEFISNRESIYKRIKKLSNQLVQELNQVSDTALKIGECYGELYDFSSKFNQKVLVGQIPLLNDIYLRLNNIMMAWGEQIKEQQKIIENYMQPFYKFAYYENETLKEFIKIRSGYEEEFQKSSKALYAKKEKYFNYGDISKWEIPSKTLEQISKDKILKNKDLAFDLMFPKETIQNHNLKNLFAHYNSETFSEILRCTNDMCQAYCKNFRNFADEQAENLSKLHMHWADLIAHFSEKQVKRKESSNFVNITAMLDNLPNNIGLSIEENKKNGD